MIRNLLNLHHLPPNINKITMRKLTIIIAMILVRYASLGQDLHYADIQAMNIWYNQSLKLDRQRDIRFNFRDIKYQSILAFRTASGMVNIPFLKKQHMHDFESRSFLNATAGGFFDKSNKGIFKNSTGLLGLSYAQRLTDDLLFLSAGFQGTFTQTSLGTFGVMFPDQFDQYGPLSTATNDPLGGGRSYNWMSLNAGLSLYQNTESKEWYIGGSVRHINRPFTDEQKTGTYRLAPTMGLQAGVTFKNKNEQTGIYALANWKAAAYEYLIGAKLTKTIKDANEKNEESTLGFGVAFRLQDAIIPNLQLKINKTTIGVHYDINVSGLRARGYSRQGIELAIVQKLN